MTESRKEKSLTISRVEAIPMNVPLREPMRMGSETLTRAENVVVRIESLGGHVGWGETTSAPNMTGDLQEGTLAAVRRFLAPLLLGMDAGCLGKACRAVDRGLVANTAAKAAVDMALHDLVARHYGMPLVGLLGGAVNETFTPMCMLSNDTPEADATEAVEKSARGVTYFKLKVGVKDLTEDIRAAELVRRAIGPKSDLAADANMAWSVDQASGFIDGVAHLNLLCLEQPVRDDDLAAMAALNRRMPVAADEGIHAIANIHDHARSGAAQGVSLKLIKLGGLKTVLRAAAVAREHGLHVNLAGKVGETSISNAALLHLAAAMERPAWGFSITNDYLEDDLVRDPLRVRDGLIRLPDGPGLGVEVDPDKIETYRTC